MMPHDNTTCNAVRIYFLCFVCYVPMIKYITMCKIYILGMLIVCTYVLAIHRISHLAYVCEC